MAEQRMGELAAAHPPGLKVARAEVGDVSRIVEATVVRSFARTLGD